MTEQEVENFNDKLPYCPICRSEKDAGYTRCFHCMKCGYLQCCDYDGFYDKFRTSNRAKAFRLEYALRNLVDALKTAKPYIDSAFMFQNLHGAEYHGPFYGEQLEAAEKILQQESE